MKKRPVIVVLGLPRDNLHSFADAARLFADTPYVVVPVENPTYARFGADQAALAEKYDETWMWGRRQEDLPIEYRRITALLVNRPNDPDAVINVLERWKLANFDLEVVAVIPGIDFAAVSAWEVAKKLKLHQSTVVNPEFTPLTKDELLNKLRQKIALDVKTAEDVRSQLGPGIVVLKHPASGGGRGVVIARTDDEIRHALEAMEGMVPHAWLSTDLVSAERYVRGTQYSIQAVMRDGKIDVFTYSENLAAIGPAEGLESTGLLGPSERGHLLLPGRSIRGVHDSGCPREIREAVQRMAAVANYRNGPLQADVIRRPDGRPRVIRLDVGWRLSGNGLPVEVDFVSGRRWGLAALAAVLGKLIPPGYDTPPISPVASAHYVIPIGLYEAQVPWLQAHGFTAQQQAPSPDQTDVWKRMIADPEHARTPKVMVAIIEHWGKAVVVTKHGDPELLRAELAELHDNVIDSSPNLMHPADLFPGTGRDDGSDGASRAIA